MASERKNISKIILENSRRNKYNMIFVKEDYLGATTIGEQFKKYQQTFLAALMSSVTRNYEKSTDLMKDKINPANLIKLSFNELDDGDFQIIFEFIKNEVLAENISFSFRILVEGDSLVIKIENSDAEVFSISEISTLLKSYNDLAIGLNYFSEFIDRLISFVNDLVYLYINYVDSVISSKEISRMYNVDMITNFLDYLSEEINREVFSNKVYLEYVDVEIDRDNLVLSMSAYSPNKLKFLIFDYIYSPESEKFKLTNIVSSGSSKVSSMKEINTSNMIDFISALKSDLSNIYEGVSIEEVLEEKKVEESNILINLKSVDKETGIISIDMNGINYLYERKNMEKELDEVEKDLMTILSSNPSDAIPYIEENLKQIEAVPVEVYGEAKKDDDEDKDKDKKSDEKETDDKEDKKSDEAKKDDKKEPEEKKKEEAKKEDDDETDDKKSDEKSDEEDKDKDKKESRIKLQLKKMKESVPEETKDVDNFNPPAGDKETKDALKDMTDSDKEKINKDVDDASKDDPEKDAQQYIDNKDLDAKKESFHHLIRKNSVEEQDEDELLDDMSTKSDDMDDILKKKESFHHLIRKNSVEEQDEDEMDNDDEEDEMEESFHHLIKKAGREDINVNITDSEVEIEDEIEEDATTPSNIAAFTNDDMGLVEPMYSEQDLDDDDMEIMYYSDDDDEANEIIDIVDDDEEYDDEDIIEMISRNYESNNESMIFTNNYKEDLKINDKCKIIEKNGYVLIYHKEEKKVALLRNKKHYSESVLDLMRKKKRIEGMRERPATPDSPEDVMDTTMKLTKYNSRWSRPNMRKSFRRESKLSFNDNIKNFLKTEGYEVDESDINIVPNKVFESTLNDKENKLSYFESVEDTKSNINYDIGIFNDGEFMLVTEK